MNYTVGIDEVGRGPWAGPLVVGAVVLGDARIDDLTDSKKLTKLKREALATQIIEQAAAYGIGWVDAAELDVVGLSEALKLATRRAVEQIDVPYHEIIIDGTVNFLAGTGKGPYVTTMKKADLLISSVSAASIIAKVARDDFMAEQAELYPAYGFEDHVGYGTAKHRQALEMYGVTSLHRRSFAPIAALLGTKAETVAAIDRSAKDIGNDAESIASDWLKADGFRIVDRNWKTKFCEIDIVAVKDGTTYFVEVKHRSADSHGGGIAAITSRKLRQMRFAASLYLTNHPGDARLAVMTTTGLPAGIIVDQWLPIE